MVIEFVVNAGCLKPDGTVDTLSFVLGNYVSDNDSTAYQKLSNAVGSILLDNPMYSSVLWTMIGFVSLKEDGSYVPLLTMQGTHEWFKSVMYFKKVIGDAGGSTATPISCGFIDNSRNLRVELENGVVLLRSVE